MRNRCSIQTAVKFAVCITLTAVFAGFASGCAGLFGDNGPGNGGLMHFAGGNASYTAEFSADDGKTITCACERNEGTTVLRVTSPERLSGLTVTYDGTNCSAAVGDMTIFLSPEVASGVTNVFDLLARADGGTPAKSADGSQTVVTYEDGTVTLSSDGIPVEVTLGERVVKIGSFVIR